MSTIMNNRVPKISVVMPVYNGEDYFSEALDSILQQDFSDFELVVIEDCSQDSSADILRDYAKRDKRIRPIYLRKGLGVSLACQRGLEGSRAPLVARMDADDISMPSRLRKQYDYLQLHLDVGLVGSDYQRFRTGALGEQRLIRHVSLPELDAKREAEFYETCRVEICCPSAMYRRELALRVGGYRSFFINGAEDRDFVLRMHEQARVSTICERLYYYRINEGSTFRHNRSGRDAGRAMARYCALRRRCGLYDPLTEAMASGGLARLPRVLGLPSSVSIEDLQQDARLMNGLLYDWLGRRPCGARPLSSSTCAKLYLGLISSRLREDGGLWKGITCFARVLRADIVCSLSLLGRAISKLFRAAWFSLFASKVMRSDLA